MAETQSGVKRYGQPGGNATQLVLVAVMLLSVFAVSCGDKTAGRLPAPTPARSGTGAPDVVPAVSKLPHVFHRDWALPGKPVDGFRVVRQLAVDQVGAVYVVDPLNSRVEKYAPSGELQIRWGSFGRGDGKFNRPVGLALDVFGDVYVADSGNNRVQKFTSTGEYVSQWGKFGTADGDFNGPQGISVSPDGTVYVADTGNHRVQVFASTGEHKATWGGFGQNAGSFDSPSSVTTDRYGGVFVADSGNNRIQKFTAAGQVEVTWGSKGASGSQFNDPKSVTADIAGNIYVADAGNKRVQRFSQNGLFISEWGQTGTQRGQFQDVSGIAADVSSNVFAVDGVISRVQVFVPETGLVPGAPRNIRVQPEAGFATVMWDSPEVAGSSDISSYRVRCEPGRVEVEAAAPTNTATVIGLAANTQYRCTVLAVNRIGEGPESVPSEAFRLGEN